MNENNYDIENSQIDISKSDAFLYTSIYNLDKLRIKGEKYIYYFVKIDENTFRIRKLSNTNNANVIFSINLKSHQLLNDLELFIKFISD